MFILFFQRNVHVLLTASSSYIMQGTYVEGIKEEVVLSPAHALSLIASGEGNSRRRTELRILGFRFAR